MASTPHGDHQSSSPRRVLLALDEAIAKLEAVDRAKTEPVAIIGLACRFPGAENPETFWQLLHNGMDAIREVPSDRWDIDRYFDPNPDALGKMYTRHGAFLDGVDQFDPQFFGISPREAVSMDPQQRLLLEVSWEALENAGQSPGPLAGSRTGVFMGITLNDYSMVLLKSGEVGDIDAYFGTGNALHSVAGRLSYVLGLQGPSMAIDTACSASLVSLHLACESLRTGESYMTLAGGVNVILLPETTVALCRAHMLSSDGRCKTFDSSANGYVRGEGCGIVVLKRLSDAVADKDNILALIRGSAVNQDGPSGGFTVPNGPAQQELIRQALVRSKLEPWQVSYVEAHGTGTPLGDPIELRALAEVYGVARPNVQPLVVGSVKTNIGHLESAAGIAGLIKVVLSLQHNEIPPHLHFRTPNPHIAWNKLPVMVPTEPVAWPCERRIAGVSSFGASGTNAHVIVEEAPVQAPVECAVERPMHLLTLSAKSGPALEQLAGRYERHLGAHPESGLGDVCYTANTGRAHFAHRLAVRASSVKEMGQRLAALAAGECPAGLRRGRPSGSQEPRVAFLFTGQGSQHVGMGRQLYESQPTFSRALDRCEEILGSYLREPLLRVLYGEGAEGALLDETAYTQPALFALEYALAELWKSWGVKPDGVLGHSVGEYVAACVAGVFSVEAGLKLMAERGRLMQALAPEGEMVAVFGSEARVARAIEPYGGEVSLASINGPESVVISGQSKAVQAVVGGLKAEGVKSRRLQVSHAFHSPLMEPMLESFGRVADEVGYSCPKIGLVSNVSGEWADAEVARAEYWCRHARQPVRFAQGMRRLQERGYEVFVEVGPKPTLLGMGRTCLDGEGVLWLPSLRPGRSDWEQMLESLGELYVRGVRVDWRGFDRDYGRRRVVLPTYPFQRQRYWVEGKKSKEQALEASRPERVQSEIVKLVERGEAQELTAVLEKVGAFSGETKERLPEMVEVLIREHQREVGAVVLKDWLYEVEWQAMPRGGESAVAAPSPGHWLILADGGGVGEAVAGQLEAGGQSCTLVVAGEVYEARAKGLWSVNPARPSDFGRLFEEVAGSSALSGVLDLWSLDAEPTERLTLPGLERAQLLGCGSALHLVQALVKQKGPGAPPLWLVTRGAVRVGEQLAPVAVGQAPLWGLGKVVGLEHPEMRGGLIDLAPEGVEEEARALVAELWDSGGEDQIALREAGRYVARLVRSKPGEAAGVKLGTEGSYLITGGLGALGLRVARWLVEQGARHVVLVGRRGATPEAQAVVSGLEAGGARVMVVKADVSKVEDVARVLEEIKLSGAPLRGIVHAAGVAGYQAIAELELSSLESVLRSKVAGAWILDRLTQGIILDFFICFSSIASVWGSKGQAHYAAANCFLDGLAHHRQVRGLPGLSVNWGPWGGGGMTTPEAHAWLAQMGVEALPPDLAVQALDYLVRLRGAQRTVANVDWAIFKGLYEARAKRRLFEQIVVESPKVTVQESEHRPGVLQRLEKASPRERWHLLINHLQGELAGVLGLAPSQLPDPRQGFFEMGMDSLMAVELKNRLEKSLGLSLSITSMFNYSTIEALGKYLYRDVLSFETSDMVANAAAVIRRRTNVAARRVNREDAKHLLAHFDQMSDDDVDALLASLSSEEENDASRTKPEG